MSIIEASELPEDEKVFLKKDFLGWRVVEPYKNEDGTINWLNLFGFTKKNLFILAAIMLIAGLLYIGISELISGYKEVADNPCAFCEDCQEHVRDILNKNTYNGFEFPELNLSSVNT